MNNNHLHLTFTTPLDNLIHKLLSPHMKLITTKNDKLETLHQLIPTTNKLITQKLTPIDNKLLNTAPKLVIVNHTNTNYKNVDIHTTTTHNIPIIYAPLLSKSITKSTFTMILTLTRQLFY